MKVKSNYFWHKPFSMVMIILFYLTSFIVGAEENNKNSQSYEAFNLGLAKCEKVVSNFGVVESVEIGLKLWLGGYFTAMNSISKNDNGVTAGKDITEITQAVIDECKSRPTSVIVDVTSDVMLKFNE